MALRGQYAVPGIEPKLAVCKASTSATAPSLQPPESTLYRKLSLAKHCNRLIDIKEATKLSKTVICLGEPQTES